MEAYASAFIIVHGKSIRAICIHRAALCRSRKGSCVGWAWSWKATAATHKIRRTFIALSVATLPLAKLAILELSSNQAKIECKNNQEQASSHGYCDAGN